MPYGASMENKIGWCFSIKDGLKETRPNFNLAKSYLEQAKASLKSAEERLNKKDYLWTTVIAYYAEYYALYSFLQAIGIKCENHFCSILAVKFLLGEERTKTIEEHRNKRIDAQYYIKIVEESKIKDLLREAKRFVAEFDDLVLNLTEEEIENYRNKLITTKRR